MSEIQALERQKREMQEHVALRDKVLKLSANPEFRDVIEHDYMLMEATRNIRIGSDPALDKDMRKDAVDMALATGHLKRYLSAKIQIGNQAENTIIHIDQELEELRQSGEDE